jgi:hypothetical protein
LALLPFVIVRGMWRQRTPVAIWALLAWPAACAVFYLIDHTLVQTRYCLLSMGSASIAVLWLLARSLRPGQFAAVSGAMLVVSLLTVVVIVIPHVHNKVVLGKKLSVVSTFIRENIPTQEPVAIMAIGQVEFDSGHRLIDLGGITQPAVAPYLGDRLAVLRWAKAEGARYFVGNDPPEPGAAAIFGVQVPYIGWTLSLAQYSGTEPYSVYRLPQ